MPDILRPSSWRFFDDRRISYSVVNLWTIVCL